jgi:hypothetical protein
MVAAALAAKSGGALPPQLWRWHICGQPTWGEFDDMSYKDLAQTLTLKRVYEAVQAFRTGRPSKDQQEYYADLVGAGIVGKDVK